MRYDALDFPVYPTHSVVQKLISRDMQILAALRRDKMLAADGIKVFLKCNRCHHEFHRDTMIRYERERWRAYYCQRCWVEKKTYRK